MHRSYNFSLLFSSWSLLLPAFCLWLSISRNPSSSRSKHSSNQYNTKTRNRSFIIIITIRRKLDGLIAEITKREYHFCSHISRQQSHDCVLLDLISPENISSVQKRNGIRFHFPLPCPFSHPHCLFSYIFPLLAEIYSWDYKLLRLYTLFSSFCYLFFDLLATTFTNNCAGVIHTYQLFLSTNFSFSVSSFCFPNTHTPSMRVCAMIVIKMNGKFSQVHFYALSSWPFSGIKQRKAQLGNKRCYNYHMLSS